MNSKRLVLAVLLCAAVTSCNRIGFQTRPSGPSVLLVTIDTLRADHVGAYQATDARTPTLDAIAREGVRFETAIAPTPMTLPSHTSILTALYPPHHGVRDNGGFRLDAKVETLAERMRGAGYTTGAVLGAFVLAKRFGLDQGFESYDDRMTGQRAVAGGFLERSASAVTASALAWLERAPRPFFLWVHYYDPHMEHEPPMPFAAEFRGRPYDGEIAYVDAELGRLLAELRASGDLAETLVVVTADHGESLGEHGELTHSYTLYDATLAVPLLLRGPGVPAGRTVSGVVSSVDIAPTILSLLALDPLPGVDGRDLASSWSGAADPVRRGAYAETLATELHHGWSPLFAVRTPDHHYVRAPRPELYDARRDTAQLRNLLVAEPQAHGSAVAAFEERLDDILAGEASRRAAQIDPDTRRRLAGLGYMLPEQPATATGMDPKDGLAWMGRYFDAVNALNDHDLDRAEGELVELVAGLPASPFAHALLARVLLLRGLSNRAARHAEAAVALVPESAEYHLILGDARLQARHLEAAEEAYRVALEFEADSPTAQAAMVWVEARAGNLRAADAYAQRARELAPDAPELMGRLGGFWEQVGHYERALAAYRDALRLDPTNPETHMHLAIQCARLGEEERVGPHLAGAGPVAEIPHLRNRLGIVYAAKGDPRAETIFRELIRRHPDYPTARRNLAVYLRKQGRHAEAASLDGGPTRSATRPR